jgi:uncharacterized protein (DUF302 family)
VNQQPGEDLAAFERVTVGLFLWWSANAALVDNPHKVLSASRFDVAETAERIETSARSRGLQVRERTDHAALAEREGYRLRPTQSLLVDPALGAEPVKLVVWQARSGLTIVSLDGDSTEESRSSGSELPHLLRSLTLRGRESTPA